LLFAESDALVAIWSRPPEGRTVSIKPAEARARRTRSDLFASSARA
jgi:hypothetical protein